MDFFLIVAIVICLYLLRNYYSMYTYWKGKGVPCLTPYPFLGNASPLKSFAESWQNIYNGFQDRSAFGAFYMTSPVLVVKDPAVIRDICIKHFNHFVDRGMNHVLDQKLDPILSKSIFLLNGSVWRRIRTYLTPAFSSSKMKVMFQLMNDCCENLTSHCRDKVNSASDRGYIVDVNSLLQFVTVDIIASCAFGVVIDSFQDSRNVFYRMALNMQLSNFRLFLLESFPILSRLFNLRIVDEKVNGFFRTLLYDTMKRRDKLVHRHPDFLQRLAEIRSHALRNGLKDDNKNLEGFGIAVDENQSSVKDFTDNEIIAQALFFFFVGKEPVNIYVSFTLYELARNPPAQKRLQKEIDAIIAQDGVITYDNLQKLEYLDMCVSETLRLWPQAQKIQRLCNHPITLTSVDGDIHVQKGMVLVAPIFSLQRDPKYFPQPNQFDPERFNKENKSKIHPFTYLPFGCGPRSCIGSRFTLMESKLIIASLLRTFNMSSMSKNPITLAPSLFGMQSKFELKVKITPRFRN